MNTALWVWTNIDGSVARKAEIFPSISAVPVCCWDGWMLWKTTEGRALIERYNDYFVLQSQEITSVFPGWTPVNIADSRMLWRRTDGCISLWSVDATGKQLSYREYGPFGGWTVLNYADDRLLWRHEDGRISLWVLDAANRQTSYQEHGPFPGWTAVNYTDGKVLWQRSDGRASIWVVDALGRYQSHQEYELAGFRPHSFRDGWLYWLAADGQVAAWYLDDAAQLLRKLNLGKLDPRVGIASIDSDVSAVGRPLSPVSKSAGSSLQVVTWTILGVVESTVLVREEGSPTRTMGETTVVKVFNSGDTPLYLGAWLFTEDGKFVGGAAAAGAEVYAACWWLVGPKVTARLSATAPFSGTMMLRTVGSATVGAECFNADLGTRRTLVVDKQG